MPALDAPAVVAQAELVQHVTPADCWIVVDGVVYDITAWLPQHPGGPVLAQTCGTDATVPFNTRAMGSNTRHSAYARAMMARMVVGVYAGDTTEEPGRPLDGKRWTADTRGRARSVGDLPNTHLTPGRAVGIEIGHHIGADANLWLGVTHGVKGWFDVSFGHATWTRESDLAFRVARGGDWLSGGVNLGFGFRTFGVEDDDRMGVFAEGVVAAHPAGEWLTIGLVPGFAWLPMGAEPFRFAGGATFELRPMNLLSLYGEGRMGLVDVESLAWGAGLRFHTWGHTFSLGVASSLAMAPLERIAGIGDLPATNVDHRADGFSVTLSLSRQFGPRIR